MTIIALALTPDRRLALVADRIYAPFSNPQFMDKPKIFRRGPVVVGVSGNICSIDLDQLLSGNLSPQGTFQAHIIYVNEETGQVAVAKPCGDDTFSTWFDPFLTGEPVAIGCFAPIADTGVYGAITTLEQAVSRIKHLHLAFGHDRHADVIVLDIDYDKLICKDVMNSYFDNQPQHSVGFRRSPSVGMPFTKYHGSKDLLSGMPSGYTHADIEKVAKALAEAFNLPEGRSQP